MAMNPGVKPMGKTAIDDGGIGASGAGGSKPPAFGPPKDVAGRAGPPPHEVRRPMPPRPAIPGAMPPPMASGPAPMLGATGAPPMPGTPPGAMTPPAPMPMPPPSPAGVPGNSPPGVGGKGRVGVGGASLKDKLSLDSKMDNAMGVKEDSSKDKKMDRAIGIKESDEPSKGAARKVGRGESGAHGSQAPFGDTQKNSPDLGDYRNQDSHDYINPGPGNSWKDLHPDDDSTGKGGGASCPECGEMHPGKGCSMGKGGDGNWIAGATKNKGALHRKLDVPEGEKIPAGKLARAEKSSDPTERKEANLAKTLKSFGKGGMNDANIKKPNAEGNSKTLGLGGDGPFDSRANVRGGEGGHAYNSLNVGKGGSGPVRRLGNKSGGGRHPGTR